MPKRSCLRCGVVIPQGPGEPYCPRHRSERRAQRQALGLTGERVMTQRDKLLREEVLRRARRTGQGCFYCGADPETADHVIPLSRGGARYDPANIVAACSDCNATKGAMSPEEFLASEWLARRRKIGGGRWPTSRPSRTRRASTAFG
jgi:5-methylcytosine-specific restriction endonuclease McrA